MGSLPPTVLAPWETAPGTPDKKLGEAETVSGPGGERNNFCCCCWDSNSGPP
jgi:hypothetical protein